MINFSETFYFRNYNIFKDTRTVLDAYLMFFYLKWNSKNIKNFLEIGVNKGAIPSLILDVNPNVNLTLIDVDLSNFKKNIIPKKNIINNIELIESNSQAVNWNKFGFFDLISVDGDHHQPEASIDIVNSISKSNKNTVIWLDDYRWKGMEDTRKILINKGWQSWIQADQGEWWARHSLQPFINFLIADTNLLYFSRIWQAQPNDNFKWSISSPQCVYDNFQMVQKYD